MTRGGWIFAGSIEVRSGPPKKGDDLLNAEIGDVVEIEYLDKLRLSSEKPEPATVTAGLAKGRVGRTKPVSSVINDERLRVRTELRVASALIEMGRIYKDLGLWIRAMQKFDEALTECGKVAKTQGANDRKLLEQCQYLLWQVFFEKEQPERAATVCLNLIRNFPNSEFADDALMAMGQAAEKREEFSRAIGLYRRLLQVKQSPLLPDAQFAVARCYEEMGKGNERRRGNPHFFERALQEYQTCAEKYPDSKFAPDAVVKIANFYYELKDYARAIEIYEKTLRDYPDAKFVDMILLNFGKCLFKMKDYAGAAGKFEQLVSDYPESEHVDRAKKYAVYARKRAALASGRAGAGG